MRLLIVILFLASVTVATYGQAPTLGTYGRDDRYTLNPGDVIDVQYRYTPEFNQTVTIQPDGFISLEIGGDLKVAGRNLTQVRALILSKARERLASPELNVILKEFQKPYVVVSGEVVTPGKVELRERMTAIQALLLAGGFKDSAKSSQVLVFRKLNADTAEVKVLDFRTLKKTADLENDLTLQAGDMLLVPRNRLSKVERYVRIASMATFLNPLMR
jgi:polysaccharide export outer membrane protein